MSPSSLLSIHGTSAPRRPQPPKEHQDLASPSCSFFLSHLLRSPELPFLCASRNSMMKPHHGRCHRVERAAPPRAPVCTSPGSSSTHAKERHPRARPAPRRGAPHLRARPRRADRRQARPPGTARPRHGHLEPLPAGVDREWMDPRILGRSSPDHPRRHAGAPASPSCWLLCPFSWKEETSMTPPCSCALSSTPVAKARPSPAATCPVCAAPAATATLSHPNIPPASYFPDVRSPSSEAGLFYLDPFGTIYCLAVTLCWVTETFLAELVITACTN